MTIKALIKILQRYNQNAEVRVVTDRNRGETVPATFIKDLDDRPTYIGFTDAMVERGQTEEMKRKKTKKVVIA